MSLIVCGDLCAVSAGSVVPGVIGWDVQFTGADGPYSASNIPRGTGRVKGPVDLVGKWQAIGHTPAKFPGDSFTFIGSVDGAKGVTVQTARCLQAAVMFPIEEDRPLIVNTVAFGNDGTSIIWGSAAVSDTSAPVLPKIHKVKISVAGGDLFAVANVRLLLSSPGRRYVASNCYDAQSDQTYYRRPDCGRLDVRLEVQTYEGDPAALKRPNDDDSVKLYVDDAQYWEFTNMRLLDVDGWGGTHEGQKPVGCRYVFGLDLTKDGTAKGTVVTPDGAILWP